MKINGNSIRPGNIIEHKNRLWAVIRIQHTQPGKGGAYIQVELKDIRDGTKLNERFRSSENVERVRLFEKEYQFLFAEDPSLHFMDTETYDQITLPVDMVGEQRPLLREGMTVTICSYDNTPVLVQLPASIETTVIEAEPVVKGQTAASSYKPAIVENGVRVMVPPHIGIGDRIIIKTEDLSYSERAK